MLAIFYIEQTCQMLHVLVNPNKAGPFESSFFKKNITRRTYLMSI